MQISCLELPFLLSLRFIVAETVYDKVVLCKIWVDIAESARLGRATRYVANKPGGGVVLALVGRTGVGLRNREEDDTVLLGEVSYVDIFTLFIL
jgi:hypothetical protein